LFSVAASVTSARMPASDPVPAVVGTSASAFCRAVTLFGPITWASPWSPRSTVTSLARSITEPPPNPTTRSGATARAAASAASRLSVSGSGRTPSKTSTRPGSPSRSSIGRIVACVSTRMRWNPCAAAQAPTSAAVPLPNSTRRGW
jgi:hypothetical protein